MDSLQIISQLPDDQLIALISYDYKAFESMCWLISLELELIQEYNSKRKPITNLA